MEQAKKENNPNYTFSKWDDEGFFEEMAHLKKIRNEKI